MSDLFGKITDARGLVEKIGSKIPGFSGYMEREGRRSADKLLREEIARRYEAQWDRLSSIQQNLIGSGGLEYVDDVESAAIKLRTFIDQVKTASYGYSGFFDAVKVNEAELAKLYDFDNALLENVSQISAAVDNLESSVGSDGLPAAIRHLTRLAAESNATFNKRQEVLTRS